MKLFLKGMRIGYWMPYGMAGVSVILCIIALIKKPKSMQELREEELMQAETKAYAEGGQMQQEPVGNPVGEPEKPAWDMDRIEEEPDRKNTASTSWYYLCGRPLPGKPCAHGI